MTTQPTALELADENEKYSNLAMTTANRVWYKTNSAELRRQHELLKEQQRVIETLNHYIGGAGSTTTENITRVEELEAQLAEAKKMQAMLAAVNKQLRTRLAEIEKQEPVAIRHSFDGYGWMYIDNGHGSGWRGGIDKPDAQFVYAAPVAATVEKFGVGAAQAPHSVAGTAAHTTGETAPPHPVAAPALTDEKIREIAEGAAKELWPSVGDVGWSADDRKFYGIFARAIESAVRGKV